MSMTYTKLFSSITESTVWCEPDRTRLVWITMLAMADRVGRVWASVPGLANRARVPLEDARIAIATFLAPDPDSRSPEEEGRRIREIDGGWQLINHAKYRERRDDEERREQVREAVAKHRAKVIQSNPNVSHGKPRKAQADAEAYSEATTVNTKEPPISPKGDDGFDLFWKTYPKKKSKGDAEKAWKAMKIPTRDLFSIILTAIERAKVSPDWTKDGGQFIPFPATWLRQKGWEDEEFTPLAQADTPGEFDHLPRIDYPCWICGCRIDPPETCKLKWHGMTADQYADGDWDPPLEAHHAGQ